MKKNNISDDNLKIMKNMNNFQKEVSFGQIYKINRMLITYFQESNKILLQNHRAAYEEIKESPVLKLCIEIYLAYIENDYKKFQKIENIIAEHAKEFAKESPLFDFSNIKESEEEMKNMIHGAFLIFMMNQEQKADTPQNYVTNFIVTILKLLGNMWAAFLKDTGRIK